MFIVLVFDYSLMAIYSVETRRKLARWVKYAIFINIALIFILVLFSWIESGPSAAGVEMGKNLFALLGFTVAAYLVQEKLQKPEDDFWRKFAEILGSIQVLSACLGMIVIIGAVVFGLYSGITGTPIDQETKPVTTYEYAQIATIHAEPTGCVLTSNGCIPIPPSPTVPPIRNQKWKTDPVVGSFVFDKSQFDPDENYYSRLGNSEYDYKVVPLDHSPDIKWTFRDDGVILFYDKTNGNLLRTGTWSKDDYGDRSEYKIKRGNWDYRLTYKNGIFQITRPDYWNMTKIE
jgi:hypothetical protein